MMAAREHQPAKVLAALLDGVVALDPGLDREVRALTFDSRRVEPGSLFFARRGSQVDGARFAAQAAHAGACAMVVQGTGSPRVDRLGLVRIEVPDVMGAAGIAAHRFFDAPSEAVTVVAVTGTNGKTSVCHYVAQALEQLRPAPVGVLGTLGASVGGAPLADSGLTTADCIANHALVAACRDAGAGTVLMEASSHALDQRRLAGLRLDTAVFTNISRDHLDYHGSMAQYAEAKARLFAWAGLRAAVINASDPAGDRMRAALAPGVQLLDYAMGRNGGASMEATLLSADATGVSLRVRLGGDETVDLRSPLIGAPAAWNLLASLGVLLALGIAPGDAARALSKVQPVPGRMQPVGGGDRPLVVVDYAHTPAALAAAAEALRRVCRGRLWCVFGAGGDRDQGKRPLMGEAAARIADRVVITDDNPRGEDGSDIAAAILTGVDTAHRHKVVVERDRARAIALAVRDARPGDVVLVAGKGHEQYQEVAGQRRPFSDVAAARAALEVRP